MSAFVGVNYATALQVNPLDVNYAAKALRANFPEMTHAKMFDYDPSHIKALLDNGVKDIAVAIPQGVLAYNACNQAYIDGYLNNLAQIESNDNGGVNSWTIFVGNEPFLNYEYSNKVQSSNYESVVPCVNLLSERLAQHETLKDMPFTISVPFSFAIMGKSFPIEQSTLKDEYKDTVVEIFQLQPAGGNQVMDFSINIYPFFAYISNPEEISPDIATTTLFGNQYQAAQQALKTAMGLAELPTLTIGETGWPSAGHQYATLDLARKFTANTYKYMVDNKINGYLFEAFDEGKKSANHGSSETLYENHFGLLYASGRRKWENVLDNEPFASRSDETCNLCPEGQVLRTGQVAGYGTFRFVTSKTGSRKRSFESVYDESDSYYDDYSNAVNYHDSVINSLPSESYGTEVVRGPLHKELYNADGTSKAIDWKNTGNAADDWYEEFVDIMSTWSVERSTKDSVNAIFDEWRPRMDDINVIYGNSPFDSKAGMERKCKDISTNLLDLGLSRKEAPREFLELGVRDTCDFYQRFANAGCCVPVAQKFPCDQDVDDNGAQDDDGAQNDDGTQNNNGASEFGEDDAQDDTSGATDVSSGVITTISAFVLVASTICGHMIAA